MKAYKVFNQDWTCRDFKYEVGKKYIYPDHVVLCESGFHACTELVDCFNYYEFNPKNKVAVVNLSGFITDKEEGSSKVSAQEITIVSELTWHDVLNLCNSGIGNTGMCNTGNSNTGDWNSGNCNTGMGNTGNRNTGDYNTGNKNAGNGNTGDWNFGNKNSGMGNIGTKNTGNWNSGNKNSGNGNTGDWNTGTRNTGNWNSGVKNIGDWNAGRYWNGYFNTGEGKRFMFNKPFESDSNVIFPKWLHFSVVEFIRYRDMTIKEKEMFPSAELTGGYIREINYKEAAKKSYDNASSRDRELTKKLPNFNNDIFEEIFGFRIE